MAISRGMVSKQLVSGKKYRKGGSVSRVRQPRRIAKKTTRFRKA